MAAEIIPLPHLRVVDTTPDTMVYFIRKGEFGPIKIGYARDPRQRIREIQTGSETRLHLLAVVQGGRDLERQLHEEFSEYRLEGEWFRPVPKIKARIRKFSSKRRMARRSADEIVEEYIAARNPHRPRLRRRWRNGEIVGHYLG